MVVVIEGRGTRHVYLAAERRRLCRVWGCRGGGGGERGGENGQISLGESSTIPSAMK